MADIVPFKRPKASVKHKGKSLCRDGFHKWVVVDGAPFDVKRGRLVTTQRCVRCGAVKTEAR